MLSNFLGVPPLLACCPLVPSHCAIDMICFLTRSFDIGTQVGARYPRP